MSVEFYLSGNTLSAAEWNDVFHEWHEKSDFELYDELEFEQAEENKGEGEDSVAYLWGKGSVRGVILNLEENGAKLRMRLNAFASRTDWAMGYGVLRKGMEKGGGTLERERGDIYGMEKLTQGQAHEDAVAEFGAMLGMHLTLMKEKGLDDVSLPVAFFGLRCRAEDLMPGTPESIPEIEKQLANRVARYGEAFRGSVMTMNNGKKVATWALIPTVVGNVDFLMIDYGNILVPLERVQVLLGERVEDLGDGILYLPALDKENDLEVLEALKAEQVDQSAIGDEEGVAGVENSEEAGRRKMVKGSVRMILHGFYEGKGAKAVRDSMIGAGLPEDMVDGMLGLVGSVMGGLQEGKDAATAFQDLLDQNVPEDLAQAVISGIADVMRERSQ